MILLVFQVAFIYDFERIWLCQQEVIRVTTMIKPFNVLVEWLISKNNRADSILHRLLGCHNLEIGIQALCRVHEQTHLMDLPTIRQSVHL